MATGAPVLHPGLRAVPGLGIRPATWRRRRTAGTGDVAAGFAAADVTYEQTFQVQRVQHVHLETHATIGWLAGGGWCCGPARRPRS